MTRERLVVWRADCNTPEEIGEKVAAAVRQTIGELVEMRLRLTVTAAVEDIAPEWNFLPRPARDQIVSALRQIALEVKHGKFLADRRPL